MTTTSARSVCTRITQRLAQSVGSRRYSMWFDRSAKFDYDDQQRRLDVVVPNRFVADWIGRNFSDSLRHAVTHEVGEGIDLRVRVHPELFAHDRAATALATDAAPAADAAPGAPAASATPRNPAHRPARTPKSLAFGQSAATLRHRLEDFISGPSNELALAAAIHLGDEDSTAAHTLFIHGGCGLGKTHLLQGICVRVLERNPQASVLYATAEQFTNEFLTAVRSNRIDAFRKRIRALDLLAVDDVHFLANKQATQQEFLHSFDSIELGGARVVLASDSHPRQIRQFSEALISRCIRGMVVQISPPDTATRAQIVRALAQRRGIPLLDTVVEVIASRCVGSVRELEGALAKLHALASLCHQRQGDAADGGIAVEGATASEGAGDGLTSGGGFNSGGRLPIVEPIGHTMVDHLFNTQGEQTPRRAIRFEHIEGVVTEQLQITRAQILTSGRRQGVVLARALIAYLARRMTPMSYPEIAAALGRKNHSTIITAVQRLEKQLLTNPSVILPATMEQVALRDLVERLKQAIVRA